MSNEFYNTRPLRPANEADDNNALTVAVLPSPIDGIIIRRLTHSDGTFSRFEGYHPEGYQTLGLTLAATNTDVRLDGRRAFDGIVPISSFGFAPGTRLSGWHDGRTDFIDVLISPAALGELLETLRIDPQGFEFRNGFVPTSSLMTALADRVRTMLDVAPNWDTLFCDTVLQSCLNFLVWMHTGRNTSTRYREDITYPAMRRVYDHVEENLASDLRLGQLSMVAGVSRAHFARAFRNKTGMTPHTYVLQRRIMRAVELLRTSPLPLAAIADIAGFADHAHLTRTFRKQLATLPHQFRK